MPTRVVIIAVFLLVLTGCQSGPNDANRGSRAIRLVADLPLLRTGMTALDIRQRLGVPASIKLMPSPDVVAETWTYYFEKPLGPTTIFNGATSLPSGGSLAGDYGRSGIGPDYLVAQRKLIVTLRLLLVNGQLSAHTATSEEKLEF